MLTTIKLRVYQKVGENQGLIRNEAGAVVNQNQLVTLKWGTLECDNYLGQMKDMNLAKVSLEKQFEYDEKGVSKEVKPSQEIVEKVLEAWRPKKEQNYSDPRDKKIAELEEQMAQLMKIQSQKPMVEESAPIEAEDPLATEMDEQKEAPKEKDAQLERARAKYKEVIGRAAHHSWGIEQIEDKIKKASL